MKLGLRELIFLTLMLGLLAGAYWYGFKRANDRKAAMQVEIAEKRQALDDLHEGTAGIEDLGRKIDELQEAIEFFEAKLPQEKEVSSVIEEVSKAAQANRLTIKRWDTPNPRRGTHYSEQPIRMSLSGDFEGFYLYLQALENLPRICRVTQMNLSRISDRNGEMQAEMELLVFYEPSLAGAVASAK